ncbi:MAG: alpha/beta hydrolase [Parcubacteria group bacterium]
MTKTQIFIVRGGDVFKNKKDYLSYLKNQKVSVKKREGWKDAFLDRKLGKKYELIRLRMPCRENAKYEEWKIYFERFLPLIKNNAIFIGSSLGGMFLSKYLSENKFPKKILGVFLIAPPYDGFPESRIIPGGFRLKSGLSLLEENTKNLYLFFSADDNVVPVVHAEKYRKNLKQAHITIYKSKKGHFLVAKFPEIVKLIKNLKQ